MATSISPLRVERPDVGAVVVLLLRQPPVAGGIPGRVPALPRGLVTRGAGRPGVAAGRNGVARLLDRAHVRPQDPVHAAVEHLLGDPLVHFAPVGWYAHHGRDRRRQGSRFHYLPAVEQVLQTVAQRPDVVRAVLHFDHDTVVAFGRNELTVGGLRRREAHENVLALLEHFDDSVQSGNVHSGSSGSSDECRVSRVEGRGRVTSVGCRGGKALLFCYFFTRHSILDTPPQNAAHELSIRNDRVAFLIPAAPEAAERASWAVLFPRRSLVR